MLIHRDAGLVRALGPLGLAASIVSMMIGAGIFAAPSALAASVGSYAPLAFLAYRSALKLRLIGARTLILGFASWTGLTACGFMLYRIVFEGRSPPIHPIVAVMGIASLVPLCRYALAPLAMYWVRHR